MPFGKYKKPTICDSVNLHACSGALQQVCIRHLDYWDALDQIRGKDFVYLDPPYEPLSKTSAFTSYTADSFDEVDQTRLFKFCQQLCKKRARFLLSNSSARWLEFLYKKDERFSTSRVLANRSINSNKRKRGPVSEMLVRNYS